MRKQIGIAIMSFLIAFCAQAQVNPAIHVDGNQLRDEAGNKVMLHGVMDTPNPDLNGSRWGILAIDDSIPACLDYFEKVFDALSDKEQGAQANVIRFHLDPVWTNNPNVQTDGRFLGEADISRFSPNRLKNYLKNFYWTMIESALNHGLYVVVRPPGVCQGSISVDGEYQGYLLSCWDIISSNANIKKYSGQISFELANEPIEITDASGVKNDKAISDFFQPIIDQIRDNGFDGIIWVPGVSWQSDYRAFVKYPLKGDNIGFAVHDYDTWFETYEATDNSEKAIADFVKYVPVVYTNPVLISEVDWSPIKEGAGYYDKYGNWITPNYGTWGTGHTTQFGVNFRAILDYFGNIGMTVSSTDSYIDMDEYCATSTVKPAFSGVAEACGEPVFAWYKEWSKDNYPSTERYQPLVEYAQYNPFVFNNQCFTDWLMYENKHSLTDDDVNVVELVSGGAAGWRYPDAGLDLTECEHLILELAEEVKGDATFRIYDNSNYWAEPYSVNLKGAGTSIDVDLKDMKTASGEKVDRSKLRIVCFQSDTEQQIKVKNISLTFADAITSANMDTVNGDGFIRDLTGRIVNKSTLRKGVYIINGKKQFVY